MKEYQKAFMNAWERGLADLELCNFLNVTGSTFHDSTAMGEGVLAILSTMCGEYSEHPRVLLWIDDVLQNPKCPQWLKDWKFDSDPKWPQFREMMHLVFLTCARGVSKQEAMLASRDHLSVTNVNAIKSELETTIQKLSNNGPLMTRTSDLPPLGFYYDLCHRFTRGEFPIAQASVQTIVGLVEADRTTGHVAELLVEMFPRAERWPDQPDVYVDPRQAFRPVDGDFQESLLEALHLAINASGVNDGGRSRRRFDFRYSLTDRITKATIPPLMGKSAGAAFAMCFTQLLSKS